MTRKGEDDEKRVLFFSNGKMRADFGWVFSSILNRTLSSLSRFIYALLTRIFPSILSSNRTKEEEERKNGKKIVQNCWHIAVGSRRTSQKTLIKFIATKTRIYVIKRPSHNPSVCIRRSTWFHGQIFIRWPTKKKSKSKRGEQTIKLVESSTSTVVAVTGVATLSHFKVKIDFSKQKMMDFVLNDEWMVDALVRSPFPFSYFTVFHSFQSSLLFFFI